MLGFLLGLILGAAGGIYVGVTYPDQVRALISGILNWWAQ